MATPHTDEDLDRCMLTGRTDIVFHLRNLVRNNEKLSVTFDEGRQSFLTVLIEVSDKDNAVYFDVAGSDETNKALMKSERAAFVAVVAGIRTQFSTQGARLLRRGGENVFAVALPKTLLRLQRRDAFRLQTPRIRPYLCRIGKDTTDEIELPLYDISVGGIGVQIEKPPRLEALDRLPNCRIDLREGGIISATLEVRYVMAMQSRTEKPLWHIGFKFVDLSPLNETLIQRVMAKIETERRALAAG